jgi:hypothetical protein
VHREFAQVAIWQDDVVRQAGRIAATPEALLAAVKDVSPPVELWSCRRRGPGVTVKRLPIIPCG